LIGWTIDLFIAAWRSIILRRKTILSE